MGLLHRLFSRHTREVWRTESRLMHRLGFVHPPEAVQWISTSVCDLKCPHCYSHAGKRTTGELTTDEAKARLIDELVKLNRPTFVIAGGETLLRKDFGELIEYAHSQGIPWAVHTHGGRVEHLHEVFEKFPPVMAAVSLDGPEEYHDDFRGRAGSFASALRAMDMLKRSGCGEVVAGTTITRQNADLLADMFPVVLESSADSWGFHLMTPEGRAGEHLDMLPTARQLRRVAAFGRRIRSLYHVELDNEWGSAGDDDCFYRDDPFVCGAGRHSCVISASGEVMPCTTTDMSESQGNVRDRSLSDIWATGFEAFRTSHDNLRSDCDDCWLQTRHGRSCRPSFTMDLFDHAGTDGAAMRKLLEERRAEAKKEDAKKEADIYFPEKERKGEPEEEDLSIGVAECDEYVEYYSKCIDEKMPEAARATSKRALATSIDAWRKASATPAGKEGLATACKAAYEAVKASCGAL